MKSENKAKKLSLHLKRWNYLLQYVFSTRHFYSRLKAYRAMQQQQQKGNVIKDAHVFTINIRWFIFKCLKYMWICRHLTLRNAEYRIGFCWKLKCKCRVPNAEEENYVDLQIVTYLISKHATNTFRLIFWTMQFQLQLQATFLPIDLWKSGLAIVIVHLLHIQMIG